MLGILCEDNSWGLLGKAKSRDKLHANFFGIDWRRK